MERRGVAIVIAAFALSAAATQPAAAVERVRDGQFSQSACNQFDCVNAHWAETAFSTGTPAGPICGPVTNFCGGGGSGYSSPDKWAEIGAGFNNQQFQSGTNSSSVRQNVEIPAGPATLRFVLHIADFAESTGSFSVRIGGTTVFFATHDTAAYYTYEPVLIDVSQFAGGTRELVFEGNSVSPPKSVSPLGGSIKFDVDDISLDAPDVPPPGQSAAGAPEAPAQPGVVQPVTMIEIQRLMKIALDRETARLTARMLREGWLAQLRAGRGGIYGIEIYGWTDGAGIAKRKKKVALARGTKDVAGPGIFTLPVRPTKAGKMLLRRDKKGKVTVRLTFRGKDGQQTSVSRSVKLTGR